jgi:lipoprotein-releasing system permease protein
VGASGVVLGEAGILVGASTTPVEIRGINIKDQEKVNPLGATLVAGSADSLNGSGDGVVLGNLLAEELHLSVGDTATMAAFGGVRQTFSVVGISQSGFTAFDKTRVYMTQKNAQQLLGRGDEISRIEIRLKNPYDADDVAKSLGQMFDYETESWQASNALWLALFEQLNTVTALILASLMLVGGFGILAVQIMTVVNKRRDIAILRSVGYRQSDIVMIFLMQGAVVSFIGAMAGSVVGHLVMEQFRTMRAATSALSGDRYVVHETVGMYIATTCFAIVVGIVASALPAHRASRVEPVDVLRGQV